MPKKNSSPDSESVKKPKAIADKTAKARKKAAPEPEAAPPSDGTLGHPWGEIWGVVYCATGLLTFVSLVSHFFDTTDNLLGPYFGTAMAAGVLYLFGALPGLFLPVSLFYAGARIFAGNRLPVRELLFVAALWLETCILMAVGNIARVADVANFFPAPTNNVGNLIVLQLNQVFGPHPFGPYFIFILLFIVTLFLLLRASMKEALDRLWVEVAKLWLVGKSAAYVWIMDFVKRRKEAAANPKPPKADPATAAGLAGAGASESCAGSTEPVVKRFEGAEGADISDVEYAETVETIRHGAPVSSEPIYAQPVDMPPYEYVAPVNVPRQPDPEPIRSTHTSEPDSEPDPIEPHEVEIGASTEESAELSGKVAADDSADQRLAASMATGEAMSDAANVIAKAPKKPKKPYKLPALDVLPEPPPAASVVDHAMINSNAAKIEQTLRDFRIEGRVVKANPGPVITQYEIELAPGVKISSIVNRADDIGLAVGGKKIRVEAPIPGKAAVGIELPNDQTQTVWFKHIIASDAFKKAKAKLPIVIGKTIAGVPCVADITKMPHMLIAGQTGAGKSVGINSFICSLLMTKKPDELRLILIDPKKVEMAVYQGIPHLLSPVVTEPEEAVAALKWGVLEMERRYRLLASVTARNIESFNQKVKEKSIPADRITDDDNKELPFIVIIVDELADLMMTASKDVEGLIQRIAQLARAVGIHLLVATQRPSVDIITGPIKANLPARIAFRTVQSNDSRTILGTVGSEKLLGRGDMLFLGNDAGGIQRYHGSFISEEDVEKIVDSVRAQECEMGTIESFSSVVGSPAGGGGDSGDDGDPEDLDEYFAEAARIVVQTQIGSTSTVQRRLKLGYTRAGRIMDQLCAAGIVGDTNGSKPRTVLVTSLEILEDVLDSKGLL